MTIGVLIGMLALDLYCKFCCC